MKTQRMIGRMSLWMIILALLLSIQTGIAAPKVEKSQFVEKMTAAEQALGKAGLTLPKSVAVMKTQIQQIEEDKLNGKNSRFKVIRLGKALDDYTVETIEQEWNGSTWVDSSKTIITYNNQGTEILSIVYQTKVGNAWVNEARMSSTVDANGNITEIRYDVWENGGWVTNMLFAYQYDANGNETVAILQMDTDEDGVPDNVSKTESTYDTSDRPTQDTEYSWDADSGEWTKLFVTTYTYNASGQLIEEVTDMDFFGLIWYVSKTVYTYNASGWVETETDQSFEDATQTWVNDTRSLYEYDANGNNTVWTDQTWDGSQWVNEERWTATYSGADGDMTEEIYQVWDSGAWLNVYRLQYTYDANGNEIQELYQIWDSGAWVNVDRTQYTYDANGNNTQTLDQVWENGAWVNESLWTDTYDSEGYVTQEVVQIWENGAWKNDTRYLFSYSGGTDVSESTQKLPENFSIQNYPNPFNPQTTIRFDLPSQDRLTLQILDVRGRVVRTLTSDQSYVQGTHQIVWDGRDDDQVSVPSGVYFYRLSGKVFKATGRCVLMK